MVRTTAHLYEDVDRQLGSERGPNGEPSAHDFLVVDLMAILDVFALRFDELPLIVEARPDIRVLVMSGSLVSRFAVVGRLASDGEIELIQLDLDLDGAWE